MVYTAIHKNALSFMMQDSQNQLIWWQINKNRFVMLIMTITHTLWIIIWLGIDQKEFSIQVNIRIQVGAWVKLHLNVPVKL